MVKGDSGGGGGDGGGDGRESYVYDCLTQVIAWCEKREGEEVGNGNANIGGGGGSEESGVDEGRGRMLAQLERKVEYNVYNWAVNDVQQ